MKAQNFWNSIDTLNSDVESAILYSLDARSITEIDFVAHHDDDNIPIPTTMDDRTFGFKNTEYEHIIGLLHNPDSFETWIYLRDFYETNVRTVTLCELGTACKISLLESIEKVMSCGHNVYTLPKSIKRLALL